MMRHVSRLAQSWGNREGFIGMGGGCGDNGQSFGAGWAEAGPSGMGIHVLNQYLVDCHGGPVIKNPLANATYLGSIPGPGRFHMSQGN